MVDQVNKNLKTYKELGEDPASLEQRTNIMKQLMIDLTNFENIPPCGEIDKRECALARKYFLTSPTADQGQNKSELTNFFLSRWGLWMRHIPLSRKEGYRRVWAKHLCAEELLWRVR